MRTRKTFTKLSNMKSLKIRTDKIDVPEISSINISCFKNKDKKLLIDLFCNDDHVQQICNEILVNQRIEDESNFNLLTHLKTEEDGLRQIDEYGNVIKRAKSFTNHGYSTQ